MGYNCKNINNFELYIFIYTFTLTDRFGKLEFKYKIKTMKKLRNGWAKKKLICFNGFVKIGYSAESPELKTRGVVAGYYCLTY